MRGHLDHHDAARLPERVHDLNRVTARIAVVLVAVAGQRMHDVFCSRFETVLLGEARRPRLLRIAQQGEAITIQHGRDPGRAEDVAGRQRQAGRDDPVALAVLVATVRAPAERAVELLHAGDALDSIRQGLVDGDLGLEMRRVTARGEGRVAVGRTRDEGAQRRRGIGAGVGWPLLQHE